jgi:cation transporter-like permease
VKWKGGIKLFEISIAFTRFQADPDSTSSANLATSLTDAMGLQQHVVLQ